MFSLQIWNLLILKPKFPLLLVGVWYNTFGAVVVRDVEHCLQLTPSAAKGWPRQKRECLALQRNRAVHWDTKRAVSPCQREFWTMNARCVQSTWHVICWLLALNGRAATPHALDTFIERCYEHLRRWMAPRVFRSQRFSKLNGPVKSFEYF